MNDDYKKSLLKQYDILFKEIDLLIESNDKVVVAIDGNSGAGKSTLSKILGRRYDCNVFHMDDFFLGPELKTKERLKEVGGNVDYVRFKEEIISGIRSGQKFRYQIYNCQIQKLDKSIEVFPRKLNIIEGVYSMHPSLIDNYDLKIFLEIDHKEQSDRILERNGESMHKKFMNLWIPLENAYFEEFEIREKSDILIDVSDKEK